MPETQTVESTDSFPQEFSDLPAEKWCAFLYQTHTFKRGSISYAPKHSAIYISELESFMYSNEE